MPPLIAHHSADAPPETASDGGGDIYKYINMKSLRDFRARARQCRFFRSSRDSPAESVRQDRRGVGEENMLLEQSDTQQSDVSRLIRPSGSCLERLTPSGFLSEATGFGLQRHRRQTTSRNAISF